MNRNGGGGGENEKGTGISPRLKVNRGRTKQRRKHKRGREVRGEVVFRDRASAAYQPNPWTGHEKYYEDNPARHEVSGNDEGFPRW